jgi:hypothetical protein
MSRFTIVEERICEIEDRSKLSIQNKDWKHSMVENTRMGIPKGDRRVNRSERKIAAEEFSKLMKDTNPQKQETYKRCSNK